MVSYGDGIPLDRSVAPISTTMRGDCGMRDKHMGASLDALRNALGVDCNHSVSLFASRLKAKIAAYAVQSFSHRVSLLRLSRRRC
jgi:hypothetical protein